MDELESDSLQPTIAVVKVEPEIYSEQDSEFASQTLEYEELKVNLDTLGFPQEFRTKSEPYMEENCESYDNLNLTFKNEGEISREELELFVKQEKPDISEESESEGFKGNNCSTDFSIFKYELNVKTGDNEEIYTGYNSHNTIIGPEVSVRDTFTCSPNMDVVKNETEFEEVKESRKRSRKMSAKKFKCELCNNYLSELSSLRRHLTRVHETLICRVKNCTFHTDSVKNLVEHTEKYHDQKIYPCEKCDFCACSISALKEHFRSTHELGNKNVSCQIRGCSYVTVNRDEMKRHRHEHIGPFKCTNCPFVGRCLEYLKKHQKLGGCLKKVDPLGVNP